MNINGIKPSITTLVNELKPASSPVKAGTPTEQAGKTFGDMLDSLSKSQNNSDQLVQKLSAGENVDISDVMIASEETDINFKIALGIRDHLVEAYREVMRMQV